MNGSIFSPPNLFTNWDETTPEKALHTRIINTPDAHQPDPNIPPHSLGWPVKQVQCRHCQLWYIEGTILACSERKRLNTST